MSVGARTYAGASDNELLCWSGEGDRHAFDLIVGRHGTYALRVATQLTGNADAAEDLVQEAFVRAWGNAHRFDGSRALFTTWLYRVIVNLSIDLRRRRRMEQLPDDFDMIDETPTSDSQIETAQQQRTLIEALQTLPVNQRAAVSLVYDEGLSGAEAARRLGLSAKAVERLLARARRLLRVRLMPAQALTKG